VHFQECYSTPGQKRAYPPSDTAMNQALAAFYGGEQGAAAKRSRFN